MGAVKKDMTIQLRIDAGTRNTIMRAAELSGKSLTSFMTEAAIGSAQRQLLEQRSVEVDPDAFDAIDAMLSQPLQDDGELVKLFRTRIDWAD